MSQFQSPFVFSQMPLQQPQLQQQQQQQQLPPQAQLPSQVFAQLPPQVPPAQSFSQLLPQQQQLLPPQSQQPPQMFPSFPPQVPPQTSSYPQGIPLQQPQLQQQLLAMQMMLQQQQLQQQQQMLPLPQLMMVGSRACRLPTKDWSKDKPVSSVIATVYSGSSYDSLFRQQTQEPPEEGVAVSLFQLSYNHLDTVSRCLMGEDISREPDADIIREFCTDVGRAADPQSVVLNFECCSCANDSGFGTFGAAVMKITKLFLDRQHMVMFGDFSLKALIATWDSSLLGPKPFVKIGDISTSFELRFDCETLKECPSSQLVTVAELCDKGRATVRALGGTIMYTVDLQASDTNRYKLEVLTVAVKVNGDGAPPEGQHRLCTLPTDRSVKGAAGHVLLRYPSPKTDGQEGLLLVSMGHWIELAHLDVKLEGIIQHATKTYGEAYAQNLSAQIQSSSPMAQMAQMQSYAHSAVQRAAPSKNCHHTKKGPFS